MSDLFWCERCEDVGIAGDHEHVDSLELPLDEPTPEEFEQLRAANDDKEMSK